MARIATASLLRFAATSLSHANNHADKLRLIEEHDGEPYFASRAIPKAAHLALCD